MIGTTIADIVWENQVLDLAQTGSQDNHKMFIGDGTAMRLRVPSLSLTRSAPRRETSINLSPIRGSSRTRRLVSWRP